MRSRIDSNARSVPVATADGDDLQSRLIGQIAYSGLGVTDIKVIIFP